MAFTNVSFQFGNSQFVVDPNPGAGSYTTINAALAASSSGDTIYIRPGTYLETLTNLGGRTLIGATVGTNAFSVVVTGAQTFTTNASTCAFQSISFTHTTGSVWTVGSAGVGNSSVYFEGCQILNSGGVGVTVTSGTGTGSVQSFFTAISGSTSGIIAANGTMRLEGSTVTGTSAHALEVGAAMDVTATNMNFISSASDAVLMSSATGSLYSEISSYEAVNAAFHYTANGTIRTITDSVDSSNGSGYFADSTGAFGILEYAALVLEGSATGIDPQITAIPLIVISSSGLVTENVTSSTTMQSNHRYYVTSGALVLTLPAISTRGDEIIVALRGGASWTIAQTAGQQIFLGDENTTLGTGGTLSSTSSGDSVTLVCQTPNTTWVVEGMIGNVLIG